MTTRLLVFSAIMCYTLLGAAQPDTTSIDLGGEEVRSSLDQSGNLSQLVSNQHWYQAFAAMDSTIRVRSYAQSAPEAFTVRNYEHDPGEWIPYRQLNILYFLDDWYQLRTALLYQRYRYSKPPPDATGGSRIRLRDRFGPPPKQGTGNGAPLPPRYPILREDVLGEFNIRKNPRYLSTPVRRSAPLVTFRAAFNKSKEVRKLYQLVLIDRTSKASYFRGIPKLSISSQSGKALAVFTRMNELHLGSLQQALRRQYLIAQRASRGRTRPSGEMSANTIAQLMPALREQAVPMLFKQQLGANKRQFDAEVNRMAADLQALQLQYQACVLYLSEEELEFFGWVLRQRTDLAIWLTAAQKGMDNLLRNHGTYGGVMVVAEYLRLSNKIIQNLQANKRVGEALQRLKMPYNSEVWAAEREYIERSRS